MALIKCPECGKEISDTAKNCINCGYALKEENNIAPPQTVVHIEAPKKGESSQKGKSSKNFLVMGITLNLVCLINSTIGVIMVISGFATHDYFDDFQIPSIVVAIISFIYSLILLAVPKLRKTSVVAPYLFVNLLSVMYSICFAGQGLCWFTTIIPHWIALIVSLVLIFISLFIKDEK